MSHGSVVHFEVPADNVDRARNFYEKIFHWHMTPLPEMNYTLVSTGPVDKDGRPTEPGFVNGGIGKREAPLGHPVYTIMVDDIDASLAEIAKHGGSTLQEKTPIGPMGFTAYFKDCEGNTVGLFQVPPGA
jgi:uncharacterized protein